MRHELFILTAKTKGNPFAVPIAFLGGKELYLDRDFYFEYGAMGISFLKSRLGIDPLFA